MEHYLNEFLLIATAHFIALLSPGADFIYVVNTSLTNRPKVAMGAALGIALSNGFYIALCLFGYATWFSKSVFIMGTIKVLGGIYLLYLGLKMLQTKISTIDYGKVSKKSSFLREIQRGFYLSFLNPKISIFYISLFALVIDKQTPFLVQSLYGIWMFLSVFIWDSILVFLLHKQILRKKILSIYGLEKIMAILLLIIAFGLLYSLF